MKGNHTTETLLCALAAAFSITFSARAADTSAHPSKAEYQKIFSDVIEKSMHAPGADRLCLPPQMWKDVDGTPTLESRQFAMQIPNGGNEQIKALQEAGLIALSGTSNESVGTSAQKTTVERYVRTEKGNKYFFDNRFCYGRAALAQVTKWKGPAVIGEYKAAWVYFTTQNSDLADWATTPAVLAAYPNVRASLTADPPKVRQVIIDLSSEGWEINEWSKALQQ